MKMKKKKVGLLITEDAHEQLREMARNRKMKISGLVEKWIELSYIKYTKKSEESKVNEKMGTCTDLDSGSEVRE